jgi:hypothetical protein
MPKSRSLKEEVQLLNTPGFASSEAFPRPVALQAGGVGPGGGVGPTSGSKVKAKGAEEGTKGMVREAVDKVKEEAVEIAKTIAKAFVGGG